MPRIDEFGSERSSNNANAADAKREQRNAAPPPAPPRTEQAANASTKRNDVQQYGAQRRQQLERQLERQDRRDADVITTGTTRGARAGRAAVNEERVRNSGRVSVDEGRGYISPPRTRSTVDANGVVHQTIEHLSFRERVAEDLQRIAPGTTVDSNGIVHRATARVPGHEQGYKLVDQLLNNPREVSIKYEPDANRAAAGRLDPAAADGSINRPGKGSAAYVQYNPDGAVDLPMTEGVRVVNRSSGSAEILAHELIHASHYQRGTRDPRAGTPPGKSVNANSTRDEHYVQHDGKYYKEQQRSDVRMREEFRTVGFKGFRQGSEPSENSIRAELERTQRASYIPETFPGNPNAHGYVEASRGEAVVENTRLRATSAGATFVDGVMRSGHSAAFGGGTSLAVTAYQQWQSGQGFDAQTLAAETARGAGGGVAQDVVQRFVSGAPSVTSGASANAFRFAATEARGAGAAGAVVDTAFAVYDEREHLFNPKTDAERAQAIGNVAGRAAVGAAAGAAGAYAGAVIGSFIPVPIVGTLAGAAVGFAVGYLASELGVDKAIASGVTAVVNAGTEVVHNVEHAASEAIDGAAHAVSDVAGGAAHTLASIFG